MNLMQKNIIERKLKDIHPTIFKIAELRFMSYCRNKWGCNTGCYFNEDDLKYALKRFVIMNFNSLSEATQWVDRVKSENLFMANEVPKIAEYFRCYGEGK